MASTTLEWYLKSGTGKKRFTDEQEQEKLGEIEVQRDVLYHAINSCDSRFIDRYFPKFREYEQEDDPNRWADLPSITEKYLDFVAWKLGQYPDNYERFESPEGKILSPGSERFHKYQRQQEIVPPLSEDWNDSMNEFVVHNMGLVVSIAKKFCCSNIPLEDLAQFGVQGHKRALYSYELSRGCKISTYATPWIRHYILRSIRNTGSTIRWPSHVHDALQNMRKVKSRLQQKKGCEEISAEEIATEMILKPETVSELLLLQHQEPSSLDNTLEKENNDANYSKTFQEYLEDKDYVSAVEKVSERQINKVLYRVLGSALSPREFDIIRGRFGLGGKEEETFNKLGMQYGLSRERMRQLESQALRKLAKHPVLLQIKEALK